MQVRFSGDVRFWRGPAPHHFVALTEDASARVQAVAPSVTYGWGMVPVTATIGATTWTTSLFPKDGGYLLPVKDVVRRAEAIDVGDSVAVTLRVDS